MILLALGGEGSCLQHLLQHERRIGNGQSRSRCTSNAPSACPPPSRRARGRSRSASACAVASPPAPVFKDDGSCELLVDPHCDFRDFVCSNRWPMDRPKSRRFRPRAPPRRRQSRGAAAARDLDGQLLPTRRQQCGQLVGSQAGPRLCGSSHHHFLSRSGWVWRGLQRISGWPTQCQPTVQSGAIKPVQHKCLELRTGLEDWETKEAVCEGRGTHLILKPSDPSSARLEFARVLVKAPKILGTWCMESDTLYVSPEGSDDNKGSDPLRGRWRPFSTP